MKPEMTRKHEYAMSEQFGRIEMAIRTGLLCVASIGFAATQAAGQNFSVWTGGVSDSWFDAGNWTTGVPSDPAQNRRAHIQKPEDSGFWPVIKNNESAVTNSRVQMPLGVFEGTAPFTYSYLTIESGGSLTINNDLRAGEDDGIGPPEFEFEQRLVGSLVVAGSLTVSNRLRFADNDFMTMDVEVTGSLVHTGLPEPQAFRIGGGNNSVATFDVSGTGFVSTAAPLEIGDSSLLTLSDDAKFTLFEYVLVDEDEFENPIFIPVAKPEIIATIREYVGGGLIKGLTNTYTGAEPLVSLGNGLSYYDDTNSITIVAAVTAGYPGDYNLDGKVDAADYTVWRDTLGQSGVGLAADGNSDETIDDLDYMVWREHFGEMAGGGASATAAPECSSMVLLAILMLTISGCRTKRLP